MIQRLKGIVIVEPENPKNLGKVSGGAKSSLAFSKPHQFLNSIKSSEILKSNF
jgi:hypothetical protein